MRFDSVKQNFQTLKNNLHDTQLEKEKLNNDFDKYLTNISKEISEFKSMPEGAEKIINYQNYKVNMVI